MKIRYLFYTALIVLMMQAQLFGAETKEYTLKNGLKVLMVEDHKAPIATFQVWYRVGSRNESFTKTGISHLLEHMMFKGTPKYGSKVFSQIIQKNGGMDNAYTTNDYTAYFQIIASDRLDLSIEMEADRMQNLLLDKKELLAERDVVMEERRLRYEDDPQTALYEELVATSFKVHPYRNPVIGWMSDLASIGQNDVVDYYRSYYAPDNAFLIVAGDIDPEKTLKKIKDSFEEIPRGKGRETVSAVEPEQRGEKRVYLEKEAQLPYMMIAYHIPRFPDEDIYALDVLDSILGGKSGRLYQNIVYEKKLALSAFAESDTFSLDPMLFYLGGTAAPGKEIDAVEEALYAEIERLKETPPSETEVQKAKNQVEAYFIMSQDSLYSQARMTGTFEIMGGWELETKYLDGIRSVRAEDVRRVVQKYFTPENRTVAVLIPLKNGEKKDNHE